jgi:hypothetical protein
MTLGGGPLFRIPPRKPAPRCDLILRRTVVHGVTTTRARVSAPGPARAALTPDLCPNLGRGELQALSSFASLRATRKRQRIRRARLGGRRAISPYRRNTMLRMSVRIRLRRSIVASGM